ncbi:hypothetical protein BT96DRAFT_376156 [Gymnopus androsaceus JB14]|uniref:Uncharacterized protein n=1 Tax=Gymnopus androsaceus JB14 TaxID=1447944 RepID=A0A6A4IN59_9AGAR|nr:hypothetical protein BT96DRAFT_376156 [Gymnopus androsaceus JB14]
MFPSQLSDAFRLCCLFDIANGTLRYTIAPILSQQRPEVSKFPAPMPKAPVLLLISALACIRVNAQVISDMGASLASTGPTTISTSSKALKSTQPESTDHTQ